MYVIPKRKEICNRRTALGLTHQQLSRLAELPDNAVQRLENGSITRTNHLRAREIARALGCEVSDIFEEVST